MCRCSEALLSQHWPRAQGAWPAQGWEPAAPWWEPCLQVVQLPPPVPLALCLHLSLIIRRGCEDRFMLRMIMSSVKNCLSMIIGCSNIVLGSKVASYNYISKDPADTSMPPILPPGKEDCELACARAFCFWRLGCRCLHLSKKKTRWWAWVLHSTWAAEPFRARGAGTNPSGHSIAPISCGGSPGCSHSDVQCIHRLPVLGMPWVPPGCCVLQGPTVLQLSWEQFLRLRLHS